MINKGYKSCNYWLAIPILVSILIATRIFPKDQALVKIQKYFISSFDESKEIDFYYIPIKDTLYYLGDDYIEVNLASQLAFLITREGITDTVKISSGNKNIPKGIETPTGLFAVQNKTPIQISRQFENTEMLNWIGINGNIGFHGLKQTGYYRSLGRRPTSHGCIRMANEDGIRWYKKIRIGIPVLVYHSKPMRVIKFSSLLDFEPNKDLLIRTGNKTLYNLLNKRLDNILEGKHFRQNVGKIYLAEKLRLFNSSIEVEKSKVIPSYQQSRITREQITQKNLISTYVYKDILNLKDTCEVPD